ncbi:MAG: hypothetical protein KDC80_09125 [Saprospiraceae bacterium]|nr:hypothetical protein [Saprospiraceae bacterium]
MYHRNPPLLNYLAYGSGKIVGSFHHGWFSVLMIFLFLIPASLVAQDIDQAIEALSSRLEDPLSITGSAGIQLSTYSSNLAVDRSAPFTGMLSAGLNISLLGVNTPLSFIYSSGGTAFNVTLPSFGFAGISPSYRGYTLHLGDRQMELGKYSFSNHSFRGVGGEVGKEKWYGKAFYGRLQRAQINDYRGFENVNTLYKRKGWGVLAGYSPTSKGRIEFSLFKGWDDPGSVPQNLLDSTFNIDAGENVIFSTNIEQNVADKVDLKITYSTSGFTEQPDRLEIYDVSLFKSFLGLLQANKSTRWNNALETKLEFQTGFGQLSLTYEKIDPGYRTLGALFFQDDQENFTGGLVTRLFNNKFSLIANGGFQRNNIAADKSDEYRRIIGSAYANYQITEKVFINLGFSNFSAVNRQVRILNPNNPNTLTELALTNLNHSGGLHYRISSSNQIAFNYFLQKNQTITTTDEIQEQVNDIQNFTLLYQNIWKSTGISSSLQLFLNRFEMAEINQHQEGIALNSSKTLKKNKIRSMLGFSYSRNRQRNISNQQEVTGNLFQTRLGFSWQLQSGQSLQMDGIIYSNRGENIEAFSESRFNLRYVLNLQAGQK